VEELVEETDFPQRVNGVEFLPGMHRPGHLGILAFGDLPTQSLTQDLLDLVGRLFPLDHILSSTVRYGSFYLSPLPNASPPLYQNFRRGRT